MIIGFALLSFFIGFTGMCSFIFGTTKIFSLRKYQKAKTQNDAMFVAWLIFYCVAIISFLHFSFAIVDTFFYHDLIKYNSLIVTFFAVQSFCGIVICSVNAAFGIRNKDIIIHHLNFVDLANAIIALSITQRAILYFAGYEHARLVSCIGGIFFSLLAGSICVILFVKISRVQFTGASPFSKT